MNTLSVDPPVFRPALTYVNIDIREEFERKLISQHHILRDTCPLVRDVDDVTVRRAAAEPRGSSCLHDLEIRFGRRTTSDDIHAEHVAAAGDIRKIREQRKSVEGRRLQWCA